jgi:hypothetical protein
MDLVYNFAPRRIFKLSVAPSLEHMRDLLVLEGDTKNKARIQIEKNMKKINPNEVAPPLSSTRIVESELKKIGINALDRDKVVVSPSQPMAPTLPVTSQTNIILNSRIQALKSTSAVDQLPLYQQQESHELSMPFLPTQQTNASQTHPQPFSNPTSLLLSSPPSSPPNPRNPEPKPPRKNPKKPAITTYLRRILRVQWTNPTTRRRYMRYLFSARLHDSFSKNYCFLGLSGIVHPFLDIITYCNPVTTTTTSTTSQSAPSLTSQDHLSLQKSFVFCYDWDQTVYIVSFRVGVGLFTLLGSLLMWIGMRKNWRFARVYSPHIITQTMFAVYV